VAGEQELSKIAAAYAVGAVFVAAAVIPVRVGDESIADAKEPLLVEWFNDSYVAVPVTQ
jgi:hypothetical protein